MAAVQRTVKVPRLVVNLQILKKFSRLGQACYTSTTSDQARKFSEMFLSCEVTDRTDGGSGSNSDNDGVWVFTPGVTMVFKGSQA